MDISRKDPLSYLGEQLEDWKRAGTYQRLRILQGPSAAEPEPTEAEGGSPKPKAGQPRIYERLPWILGLMFGMLGVGGTLLYRRSAA